MRLYFVIPLAMLSSCSRIDTSASIQELVSKPRKNVSIQTPFAADSLLSFSYDQLIATFGEENLTVKEAEFFDGQSKQNRVVLYPAAEREIHLTLNDSTAQADVIEVMITKPSIWQTRAGLSTGMTLIEVENLNGKPFLFYGGGWDQGGQITNWNDGRLKIPYLKRCRMDREFMMPYDMSKGDYDSHEFSSNSKDARKGNPVVEEITLVDR